MLLNINLLCFLTSCMTDVHNQIIDRISVTSRESRLFMLNNVNGALLEIDIDSVHI